MTKLLIIPWTILLLNFYNFTVSNHIYKINNKFTSNFLLPPSPNNDYKVNANGRISLAQKTTDEFDRLIFVDKKKEKIHYHTKKEKILNPHIKIKKGILDHMISLKGRANGQHFKGIQLSFKEDFNAAKIVFTFLADHTSIEWSLLSFGINKKTRTFIYTSFRSDLEYFGSIKVHHILNYPETIDSLKHYHNHPRTPIETIGKYAFPSNSDLDFRNKVLATKISIVEFLIRTDGFFINYTDPKEWNKMNGEDWM